VPSETRILSNQISSTDSTLKSQKHAQTAREIERFGFVYGFSGRDSQALNEIAEGFRERETEERERREKKIRHATVD
jgi:hypothetical protein